MTLATASSGSCVINVMYGRMTRIANRPGIACEVLWKRNEI